MHKIHTIAPAKINLCLEVVQKYENGFHALRSIMLKSQKIYDDIDISFNTESDDIVIECDHPGVPTDDTNICYKIAQKYFDIIGKNVGLHIVLVKRIPPLTGLGGGSSNGACVLLALNAYFDDVLSFDVLVDIAASVGKDIPFFLQDASAARVSGAGEKVESIFNFPHMPILVVNPGGEISTPWAYGQLDEKLWFMHDKRRINMTQMMQESVGVINDIVPYIYNDFSLIAEDTCPIIKEIYSVLRVFGARAVSISGKGPTVFGVFAHVDDCKNVQIIIKERYPHFFVSQY